MNSENAFVKDSSFNIKIIFEKGGQLAKVIDVVTKLIKKRENWSH